MNKILWNDLETGGTDFKKHALLQIACAIESDGEIVETFTAKMKPFPGKIVDPKSIEIHGITLEEIETFDPSVSVYQRFRQFCSRHGQKGNKSARFIMAGYCNEFDIQFLKQWHDDCSGGPYAYWDYLQMSPIDPLSILRAMRYAGILPITDTKLETVCDFFGIKINAHDALSDMLATRELTKCLFERIFTQWTGKRHGLLGPLSNKRVEIDYAIF